jgi:hypothetical protein
MQAAGHGSLKYHRPVNDLHFSLVILDHKESKESSISPSSSILKDGLLPSHVKTPPRQGWTAIGYLLVRTCPKIVFRPCLSWY